MYAARLKSEMKPMLDELRELNGLDDPTDEQKSLIDTLTVNLAGKKAEYDKAMQRSQKALDAETMYDGLTDDLPQPPAPSVPKRPAKETT
jgi:hypothetical protein